MLPAPTRQSHTPSQLPSPTRQPLHASPPRCTHQARLAVRPQAFIGDWFRWQQHLERAAAAPLPQAPSLARPPLLERCFAAHAASESHLSAQPGRPEWNGFQPPTQDRTPPGAHAAVRRPATAPAGPIEDLGEDQLLDELVTSMRDGPSTPLGLDISPHQELPELELSTARLAMLARNIELLSGKRMPQLQKQKRDYVSSWMRLAIARRRHRELQHTASPAARAPRVDANPIRAFEGVRRNSNASGALRSLLDDYPLIGGQDGSGEVEALEVPIEHLAIVTEQVEQLTGRKAPRQPRARREYLAAVYRTM